MFVHLCTTSSNWMSSSPWPQRDCAQSSCDHQAQYSVSNLEEDEDHNSGVDEAKQQTYNPIFNSPRVFNLILLLFFWGGGGGGIFLGGFPRLPETSRFFSCHTPESGSS